MTSFFKKMPLFAVLLLLPNMAHAHLIGGNGLASGVTHPFFGIDHLMAMVAVGVLSVIFYKKKTYKLPLTFIVFMVFGGILGSVGVDISFLESIIALSVVFLGAFMIWGKPVFASVIVPLVGFFAIFHGFAHGAEMPQVAHPAWYTIGFVLSTAILHFTGILMAQYAQKRQWATDFLRYSGAAMSVVGMYLLMGI